MLNRRELLAAIASSTAGAMAANVVGDPLAMMSSIAKLRKSANPVLDRGAFFRTSPIIGRVTNSDAMVNLVTSSNLTENVLARVRWATTLNDLPSSPYISPTAIVSTPATALELPLSGLSANEEYVYRVEYARMENPQDWNVLHPVGAFNSQKSSGRAFSFCLTADAHWGQQGNVPPGGARWITGVNCLHQMVRNDRFDFMIDLGDSPFPSVGSFDQALDKYLEYRDILSPIARRMPVFLALGNHECEAGFYQRGTDDPAEQNSLWNQLAADQYRQLWATRARHIALPNPRGDTYPEGGEGAPGYDSLDDWFGAPGPWNDGAPTTHLQNFFAWTWGDALFIVLDPFRYTLVGSTHFPNSPTQYCLGPTQMQWLEDVLANSTATWKFIFAHHLVGGGLINRQGNIIVEGGDEYAYGRGSAIDALRTGTDQARIHELMVRHGAQFFVYGHDHAFSHSSIEGVQYIGCGRATHLNNWWHRPGMTDSYGNLLVQGQNQPWMHSLFNIIGYCAFHVEPDRVSIQWMRTGYSYAAFPMPIQYAMRDWYESWAGRTYPVDSPHAVTVRLPPKDVNAVRTLEGAVIPDYYEPPTGVNYYSPGGFLRSFLMPLGTLPLESFPDETAVVDTVPEIVHEMTFETS